MRAYLFRHGPAESRDPTRWPEDEDRPLTRPGERETRAAALGFAEIADDVNVVVASPAVRARRTAEHVHAALGIDRGIIYWDELRPGSAAAPVLERLGRLSGRPVPVLVGHEPTLSELVGLALSGDSVSYVHVGKAGAVAVDFASKVAPGAGELAWLLTRGQLGRLG
ncbi:MAG TPA: histidine phosphatase family protein [Thermoplasmata archaeon]|nr:histidine phosphatase family protein [Thermoplasmata archaeon]